MSASATGTPLLRRIISAERAIHLFWLWTLAGYASFMRLFLSFYCPTSTGLDRMGFMLGHDFPVFWGAAKLAVSGRVGQVYSWLGFAQELKPMLLPGAVRVEHYHFPYPPHILALLLPFALFSYFPGFAVWTVVGMALFLWPVRANGFQAVGWLALCAIALSPASVMNTIGGQNGYFTAALMLGGLYLSDRRPVLAGILFGCLTFKPQLGLLVPFVLLARRNWKCIAAAAGTGAGLVLLSFILWGPDVWGAFGQEVFLNQADKMKGTMPWAQMTSVYTNVMMIKNPGFSAIFIWLSLQCAATAWALWAAYTAVRREGINARTVFLVTLGAIVASPYSHIHDLTATTGAWVVYILSRKRITVAEAVIYGMLWAFPMFTMEIRIARLPFNSIILLAAFAAVCFDIFRSQQVEKAPA